MSWPHRLLLWKPNPENPGSRDEDSGILTPPDPAQRVTLYDGDADVQELPAQKARTQNGEPAGVADAVAFLADEFMLAGRNAVQTVLTDDTEEPELAQEPDGDPQVVTAPPAIIAAGAFGTITYEDGSTQECSVIGVRRLDGAVLLKRAVIT